MTTPLIYYSPAMKSWVLGESYQVGINGSILCIKAGYAFDMASVPRILWPWISSFDLGTEAPLLHDVGYQGGGHYDSYPPLDWSRRQVDSLFRRIMADEGVGRWKRTVAWLAVRAFGWLAWHRKSANDPLKCANVP